MLDWYKKDGSSYESTPEFSNVAYVIEEIEFAASDEPFAETMTIKINGGNALTKKDELHTGEESYLIKNSHLFVDVKFDIEPCKTIADILGTVSGGFPTTSESAQVPENAWLCNSNNKKIYIFNNNLAFNPSHTMAPYYNGGSTSTEVSEDNNNYTATISSINYTFVMKNDVLSSIVCVSSEQPSYSGTYVAPTTIADILPNDFPNSSDAGWVKEENGKKVYLNNTTLTFDGTSISTDMVVTKEENNYKYVNGFFTYVFVVKNNVLKSIELTNGLAPAVSGIYVPYRYTNSPISKPIGYTGDIEFVTNAVYTNDSDVFVYIDNNIIPLSLNQDYTLSHNSTHVKLKGSYVNTLDIGTHTITIAVNGYNRISQEFIITPAPTPTPEKDETPRYKVPNTGVRFIK